MTRVEKEQKAMRRESERRQLIERIKALRSSGYSNSEIGKLIGKSESTVRALLGLSNN